MDDVDKFLRYAIMSQNLPEGVSVQAVEGFLKVHKNHVEGSISFMGLLKDLPQDEDVVDAGLAFPESCLFLCANNTFTNIKGNKISLHMFRGHVYPAAYRV
ncbi:hypothetical protein DPMN_024078 [Dreissena polymorpha]|uniref:Uncharacterized protein n=1 Tax=Dreissena polymorpha TaxID=45954 RepID=A0A9D4RCD2_DREPO|nr:hypothetical protein DPMN_024078 [Dreissena polymorpha]